MKKIFMLFLTICMVSMMFACNASESPEKKVPKYGIQMHEEFQHWKNTDVEDEEEEYVVQGATEITSISEVGEEINSLGNSIVAYINSKYGTTWAYEYVTIKAYDFSGTKFANYNAYYSVPEYTLYLNSNYQYDSSGIQYIIAHELIHYVRHLNLGTTDFQYENTNGLGKIMMEALTDLLVIEMYENTEEVENFFLNNSSYCYAVVSMKILKQVIPDLMYYYVNNDIVSLEKEFNLLADKYIDFSGTSVENPFVNYLDVIDTCQITYIAMVNAYLAYAEDYIRYYAEIHQNYQLGQYELSLMLLSEADNKTKKKALAYVENLYRTEFEAEGYFGDEFYKAEMEYLKSCVK